MSYWLRIESDPPVALYRERAALEHVTCDVRHAALISLGTLSRPLSRPNFSAAQTASLEVRADNADGALTAEFGTAPPIRAAVSVYDDAALVFTGVVTAMEMGPIVTLSLESGLRQPLSDPLPLRSSSVWGEYAEPVALPHGYGRITVAPVQYSQDRRRWMLLDHPIQGVDAVTRDDVATSAWAWSNTLDAAGHALAILDLAEPLADGERLAVTLRGKMHATSGRLLTRPDEIIWDVLANVCGMPIALSDLDGFRVETEQIELAGVLDDATRTARAQIDIILASVGAAWSGAMPGLAIAWPPAGLTSDPDATVGALDAVGLVARAERDDMATVLRVLHDYDWAAQKHRQALQIEAPEAIERYGRIEREIDAGWLHSARLANQLAERLLGWMARPVWTISWGGDIAAPLNPGDWVALSHPSSPVSGAHRLIRSDLDMDRGRVAMAIQSPVGPAPTLSAARLSAAFSPYIQAGAAVIYQDGLATFTVLDDLGHPLAGATVTLDGGARRITDGAGRAQFKAARGAHVLLVEAEGYNGMRIEVAL